MEEETAILGDMLAIGKDHVTISVAIPGRTAHAIKTSVDVLGRQEELRMLSCPAHR